MSEVLVTRRRRIVRFTCHGVPAKPGVAGRLFGELGKRNVNIVHMFNTEHGKTEGDISFSVSEDSHDAAREAVEHVKDELGIRKVTEQHGLAILSFDLEEINYETVLGTMAVSLSALERENVDVKHIAASRSRVFVVLDDREADKAAYLLSRVLKEEPIIHPI